MDDTDRKLLLILYEDPRMSIRDIAKKLGMSRQAAHQRLRALAKAGVFKDMKAAVANYYLDGVPVLIWGRSNAMSVTKSLNLLGESELTQSATVSGGRELCVFGYLRRMSELSDYVDFVRRVAEMPDVTVGFPNFEDGINPVAYDGGARKESYQKLSPLDLRIIDSLQGNARKPIGDIADEVGASQKTVRRHIERMRRGGSLDFDTPLDIPSGEEMVTMVYVTLRKNADIVKAARRLLRVDPVHFIVLRSFSNIPDLLRGVITSDRMAVIRRIIKEVENDEDVLGVSPNLIYAERVFDSCWDYDLDKVASVRKET